MAGKTFKPAANHLRAWRERAELTQSELAEKVGTKAGVISELESGKTGLSDKWLNRLAPVLGTRPGFLLEFDPADAQGAILTEILAIPKDRQVEALQIIKVLKARK